MSYTVSGSGHAADPEKAMEAFRQFIEALDEASADPEASKFGGQISGSDWHTGTTRSWSLTADQARAGEPGKMEVLESGVKQ